MEQNHEALAGVVANLAGTVARVELNQTHQAELNKLRFDALDTGVGTVKDTLERFMGRINAIVTGEVKLPQAEQGERLVSDYLAWRKEIETRLDAQDVRNGKIDLLGKIAVILVGGNVLGLIVSVISLLKP